MRLEVQDGCRQRQALHLAQDPVEVTLCAKGSELEAAHSFDLISGQLVAHKRELPQMHHGCSTRQSVMQRL